MVTANKRLFTLLVLVLISTFLPACRSKNEVSVDLTSTNIPQPSFTPTHIATSTHAATVTPTQTAFATPTEAATSTPTQTVTVIPTETQTSTASPTETPLPTHTATPLPSLTPTTTPTKSVVEAIVVEEGGFTFEPVPDFIIDIQGDQVGITNEDDEILLFMAANRSATDQSLQEILDGFIENVSIDMGEIIASDAYSVNIGGIEGIASDVSGQFLGGDMDGRVAVVAPTESFSFIAFGLAINDRWNDEGMMLFDTVSSTISFDMDMMTDSDSSNETDTDFPLPIPSGKPENEWNDLPIMPQAIAGEEGDESYYFTVEATFEESQNFYEDGMKQLGWTLLGVGEGDNGALLMIFQNEAEVASVSILSLDNDTLYVFLVK